MIVRMYAVICIIAYYPDVLPVGTVTKTYKVFALEELLTQFKTLTICIIFYLTITFLYLARVCCCIICLVLYYLYYFRPSILCTDRVSFTPHLGALASES